MRPDPGPRQPPATTQASCRADIGEKAVSERIYMRVAGGGLEPLEEQRFSTEDELQSLIAEHLGLLGGEQVRPGDPRRWICVCREKGVAEIPDAAARWAVDLLVIDQDAIPTLVEVKRGANPEIRRAIVGQMLEYAAHAAGTWTADELRRTFEETTRASGLDPGDELATLLQTDGEPDAEDFWGKVAVNLDAKRLRLLFVADDIPDPLKRIVAFLNEQMSDIEVLAVEVKQFRGGASQTIVPRVTGNIAPRPIKRGRSSRRICFCRTLPVPKFGKWRKTFLKRRARTAPFCIGVSGASAFGQNVRDGLGRSRLHGCTISLTRTVGCERRTSPSVRLYSTTIRRRKRN